MTFAEFGGQYVDQILKVRLDELSNAFESIKKDETFKRELNKYLEDYVGRKTPLYYAERLTKYAGGAKIYLKREDLNHTGAHKINNALGQILLAKKMGKTKIIAETGAGQHGVATATVCALFNMNCIIFMGEKDIVRQQLNVKKMELLGAKVISVKDGQGTLKEAVDAAFDYYRKNDDCFYLIGSAVGPSPYPEIVKYFQKIIGEETRAQILQKENKLPNAVIACVGGGSNSIGMFTAFLEDKEVQIFGVEAAGKGLDTNEHSCAMKDAKVGILHGMKTYILADENGNSKEAYSISAGLDYPGVGPEHAYLKFTGRVTYDSISDKEAVECFKLTTKLEGIIPALESSHAIAYALKIASNYKKEDSIVVCLSGRGDKDLDTIFNY